MGFFRKVFVAEQNNRGLQGKDNNKKALIIKSVLLVRVTRLELVRRRHTPLKRACLPIPAHSHIVVNRFDSTLFIISPLFYCVKAFLKKIKEKWKLLVFKIL